MQKLGKTLTEIGQHILQKFAHVFGQKIAGLGKFRQLFRANSYLSKQAKVNLHLPKSYREYWLLYSTLWLYAKINTDDTKGIIILVKQTAVEKNLLKALNQ